MTKIDIVSGFLGAGKTTLIQKLLKEALNGTKVVLIENEFGEIGIDGGFLKDAGIEIKEMNSGCICCSLVGDFGESLKEVLATYTPERVIIEPSGVGKLSDVMAAVQGATETADVELNSAVAVVDAKKAKMYIKNFGEFFINQIEHAGTVILSRTDAMSEEKVAEVVAMVRQHNEKATIITTPWPALSGEKILETIEGATDLEKELMEEALRLHEQHEHEHHHDHGPDCTCGCHDHDHEHDHEHHHDHDHVHEHHHDHDHEHEHHHDHDHEHEHHHDHEHEHHHDHDHGPDCTCGCHDHDHEHEHHHDHDHHHHHHADEVFTSVGMETPVAYTMEEIQHICHELEHEDEYGLILRAKGMVAGVGGDWIYFDYTPGEADVRNGSADVIGKFCVIGSNLNENALKELFAK